LKRQLQVLQVLLQVLQVLQVLLQPPSLLLPTTRTATKTNNKKEKTKRLNLFYIKRPEIHFSDIFY
jgi:hypothetical protein